VTAILSAVLLFGVCLTPLTFDNLGPPCGDPMVECRCSECFVWDDSPRATRFEVERTTVSTGTVYTVGVLNYQAAYMDDEVGQMIPEERPETVWCAPKDDPFPHEGVHYRYRIRACNEYGCADPSPQIDYVAAPYACWEGGVEKPCYVADPLVKR
jgi:hypothetical protein